MPVLVHEMTRRRRAAAVALGALMGCFDPEHPARGAGDGSSNDGTTEGATESGPSTGDPETGSTGGDSTCVLDASTLDACLLQ